MTDPTPDPDDETPPWHAYDGCYGCRHGNAIARKAVRGGWEASKRTDGGH